ncbi:hypothetical protein BDA99DRAFT_505097 [Phascolomyces articulosus]|uniref:Uncharacterized protein n=1 Tax=Phascolomyces articulosus TaxID=60185 RepID=A0AAD5PG27_9FUNG|nr:hypothetical protein BDA99DRAFT_505097 [Phascolomyces articulosus]
MPKNRGSRGGSFRGRGRGGGGRGRGRGNGRNKNTSGGGRGRGRKLYPTAQGYVYKVQNEYYDPESSEDDLDDDFPVFGQFGAVDDPNYDPDIELVNAKEAASTKQRKVLDHRALLNSRQTNGNDSEVFRSSSSRSYEKVQLRSNTYTKAVTFTRSSTVLNEDSNNEKESTKETPESESIVIEEADESAGFYFDSNPSDIVIDEIVDDHETDVQHDEIPTLGFYFDSNPSPVSMATTSPTSSSNHNNNGQQQQSTYHDNHIQSNNKNKNGKSKQRQKRKIIKGDDIYLGSSSSDTEDERIQRKEKDQAIIKLDDRRTHYHDDDDDDIAIMRDYIENVRLDDDDDDLEALRAFANGTDASAQNYPEVVITVSSDSDEEDDYELDSDEPDDAFDTVENGGFDHQSDDESIQEISEQDFRYALEQSIDDVPPSLQTGIRNRIARESKRDKKLAKKQKRLDKNASKQAKREYEGNNVQLRNLDKYGLTLFFILIARARVCTCVRNG